jgi:hypothetical protein
MIVPTVWLVSILRKLGTSTSYTGRLLVSGTKTRQMHAGSLPAQFPSRGSGDRRAVYDYKNVRNTYQITINVENDPHPLAHTPDTTIQGL